MRRQSKPFAVEVKQKRVFPRPSRSIWGDVDLSDAIAETKKEFNELDTENREFVDSNVMAIDAARNSQSETENNMAADAEETATEPATIAVTLDNEKNKPSARTAKSMKRSKAQNNGADGASATAKTPASRARTGRKIYSEKERAEKLMRIQTATQNGETLKSAVKQAGISEQTYYIWKKAAKPDNAQSDELADLVALEKENKRLKSLLAERLRKENAELKRKLGM